MTYYYEIKSDKIFRKHTAKYVPIVKAIAKSRGIPFKVIQYKTGGQGQNAPVAGTYLKEITQEAKDKLEGADLIISKGQGNFETLNGCELNVYYLFLCKCTWFVSRFQLRQFEGVFINDNKLG